MTAAECTFKPLAGDLYRCNCCPGRVIVTRRQLEGHRTAVYNRKNPRRPPPPINAPAVAPSGVPTKNIDVLLDRWWCPRCFQMNPFAARHGLAGFAGRAKCAGCEGEFAIVRVKGLHTWAH